MTEGTVRWFGGRLPDGKTRGYGFILQDSGEEIFVHYSEIEKDKDGFKTLREGQRVAFEVGEGQDGKAQAVDVRVIGEAQTTDADKTVAAAEAVAAAALPGANFDAASDASAERTDDDDADDIVAVDDEDDTDDDESDDVDTDDDDEEDDD